MIEDEERFSNWLKLFGMDERAKFRFHSSGHLHSGDIIKIVKMIKSSLSVPIDNDNKINLGGFI